MEMQSRPRLNLHQAIDNLESVRYNIDRKRAHGAFHQDFTVERHLKIFKEIGQGAYGIVCGALEYDVDPNFPDDPTKDIPRKGSEVAIKKVTNVFSKKILAKRALREIKLLQHFRGHRNITNLETMYITSPRDFNEVYITEELMECDLAAIIRSGQNLSDAHFQSFIYQILCGLKYIHSANVLHRDLKPGNLLVNADCELKICDFGLARGFSVDPKTQAGYMTEYVATRWYRAPEIMLSFSSYTKAIDVWSVGCILAELLGGRPFFKGKDYVDQLNKIIEKLGTPNEETLQCIGSPRAQEYIRNLPYQPKIDLNREFSKTDYRTRQVFPPNPDAIDLLDKMLAFNPSSRISVDAALEHPYLAVWHDPTDEPGCPELFNFDFEVEEDIQELKKLILLDVAQFRVLREMERSMKDQEAAAILAHEQAQAAQQQQQQQQQQQHEANGQYWQQQQQQQQYYQQQGGMGMGGQYRVDPQQAADQPQDFEKPRPEEAPPAYGVVGDLEQELAYGSEVPHAHAYQGQRY